MLLWFHVINHWHGPSAFPDCKLYLFCIDHSPCVSLSCSLSPSFFSPHLSTSPSRLCRTFPWGCQEWITGERPGQAVMSVIKDHLKKSRNKTRDQQVEGRTKKTGFTSTLFQNVLRKLEQRGPFFFWIKTWRFFSSDKHTKKLLSGPLLRLDFLFKNQSFTKHRKMQHWTQHKKTAEIFRSISSLYCLAALGFPKTGNDGNDEAVLGILDGNVKGDSAILPLRPHLEWFSGAQGSKSRAGAWRTVAILSWRKPNACTMMPLPPSLAKGSSACWCAVPLRWQGALSRWISGRPFSSGRQYTTCHGSPSHTPFGTSSPRHAPSGWGGDMEKSRWM